MSQPRLARSGACCVTSPCRPSPWPSSPACPSPADARRRPTPARGRPRPGQPVSYATAAAATVKGQFLSYNDFHGAIDPPGGSGGVNGTPAGGVEYLAT